MPRTIPLLKRIRFQFSWHVDELNLLILMIFYSRSKILFGLYNQFSLSMGSSSCWGIKFWFEVSCYDKLSSSSHVLEHRGSWSSLTVLNGLIMNAAPKGLFPPEPVPYNGPKLKVAIIGAGLAGMSTAVELLDQGHEVFSPLLCYLFVYLWFGCINV